MSEREQLRQKTEPPEALSASERPEMVPLRVFLRARYRLRDARRAVRRLEAAAEFWGVDLKTEEKERKT